MATSGSRALEWARTADLLCSAEQVTPACAAHFDLLILLIHWVICHTVKPFVDPSLPVCFPVIFSLKDRKCTCVYFGASCLQQAQIVYPDRIRVLNW